MPLIIITGKPCTGKTSFAERLVSHLKESGKTNVELINEESLNISKKDGYKNSFAEKGTRGALKGASDHKLNTECFVIVDSLNYIKGYRYELYCTARTFRTPHCVVWVGCNDNVSTQWNEERITNGKDAYDPKILDDLRMRYEAPNEANRWDFPLFKVTVCPDQSGTSTVSAAEEINLGSLSVTDSNSADISTTIPATTDASATATTATETSTATATAPVKSSFTSSWKPKKKVVTSRSAAGSDDTASVFTLSAASVNTTANTQSTAKAISFSGTMVVQEDTAISGFLPEEETFRKMDEYFGGAVAAPPNSSTIATQRANADLLYELDRVSQQIIQVIVAHQTEGMVEGTPLKFVEYDRALTLNRHTGLAELQRYRRQYVKINGQHPPTSSKAIGTSFIDFLALHL